MHVCVQGQTDGAGSIQRTLRGENLCLTGTLDSQPLSGTLEPGVFQSSGLILLLEGDVVLVKCIA